MEKTGIRIWLILLIVTLIAVFAVLILKSYEGITNITDATLV